MKKLRITGAALGLLALLTAAAGAQEPALGWSDIHDGGAGLLDDGVAVLAASDGSVLVGGMRTDPDGPADILIRKLDSTDGSVFWTYEYIDPDGNDMELTDMVLDHRGDLLVAGYLSACDS
jgi:hypothetical protein